MEQFARLFYRVHLYQRNWMPYGETLYNANRVDRISEQMYTISPIAVNSADETESFDAPIALASQASFLVHRKRKATPVLQHTSCHAPGLGPQNERLLWDKGLRTWRDLLWSEQVPLTPHKADALIDTARRSTHHLSERNPHFL